MSLDKTYDPKIAERWYDHWEKQGYFKPRYPEGWTPEAARAGKASESFVISMPPPNVTGELHLGHAMTATLEDIMIRFNRMRGRPTLWLPGTDHAGIATQAMVERMLATEGTDRHQLGRERFLERVWEWKNKYGGLITEQHRGLGASCDWSRERFTLDAGLSRAVRETFVRLHRKGLIYRADRIVNWCPNDHTALSDLEVEHEERNGHLWHVRYPLLPAGADHEKWVELGRGAAEKAAAEATEWIEVATTRPETILGDTGVAVNPGDPRYGALIGRLALLPEMGRVIPIVADDAVEASFGTGAVKVTPAHDPTDFDIGRRHDLPSINVMNPDGTMNERAGSYAGQDRTECRVALVEYLEGTGQLLDVKEHRHAVGTCYRCDTVVEPLVLPQWYVDIKPLAEKAIAAVRDGDITIVPERFTKTYMNWMENIRDWCISRQLWWGHRIPVWYCDACNEVTVEIEDPTSCSHCGSTGIRQDEDVLDTWFSSGLWPFSTLGWPDEDAEDYRNLYPTNVMETGYDILFFWVARMIMMGIELTGEAPFKTVYMHGLIRDEKGDKMSKTRGNVVNPLKIIDEYGCDALRYTLSTGSTPGNDMRLTMSKIEGSRNFANKLWNASRLVLSNLEGVTPAHPVDLLAEEDKSPADGREVFDLADRWILSRLQTVISEVTAHIEGFDFGKAGTLVYEFLWNEFCDWYLELAKAGFYGEDAGRKASARSVSAYVLDMSLRLLHPYMPFITEEIWQKLSHGRRAARAETVADDASEGAPTEEALIVAAWPAPLDALRDAGAEADFELIREAVVDTRRLRVDLNVPASARLDLSMKTTDERTASIFSANRPYLAALCRVNSLDARTDVERPENSAAGTSAHYTLFMGLGEHVDVQGAKTRLSKRVVEIDIELKKTNGKLGNPGFTDKAPADVVEKERRKSEDLAVERKRAEELLSALA